MMAPASIPSAPDETAAIYEAAAEALQIAEAYASTGVRFASVHDARGLAYACRSAAAALETAASLVVELRPSANQGRRAA